MFDIKQELMKLMELHYINGIDFPFLHKKEKTGPRKIVRKPAVKPNQKQFNTRVWKAR
ncbi:MAG: hypothetical protein SPL08_01035 [Pseudomonadota bacterium]|nr:hypothetical protein [Pseudomonadota bacterium]